MKTISKMNRAELAAFVQEHLRTRGIDMVLSGGACVSVYSHGKYISMDLDMIHISLISPKRTIIREVMFEIGFGEEGRYFKHRDTDLFVEFPSGPPAVGNEPVKEIIERRESTGMLKIISPTDCVKDRLAAYYYWGDMPSLQQAILVAHGNPIDHDEIERWSRSEGKHEQFEKIRKRLKR
jgi:hypothetical protein